MLLFASKGGNAHILLALALKEAHGLTGVPTLSRGSCGKPFFPDYPHIRFSLSHSGLYALCAVGECEVGVDIEEVRPRSPALPGKVLTHAELCWYEENGADWPAFYTLWTRKESHCKRQGRGVARPHEVCPPLPGENHEVRSFFGPGWVAAVCSGERIPPIRWLDDTDS